MTEENVDESKVQDGDPKGGLNMEQLKRVAGEGKDDHIHKLMDGSFTSGEIKLDTGGHVHTYEGEHGTKRTSIAEDHEKHTHETEQGTTGLPE